jgi:hypothetical protein
MAKGEGCVGGSCHLFRAHVSGSHRFVVYM